MRQGRNKDGPPQPQAERALDQFGRFLAERSLRLTAARTAIVVAALERRGHFPIEDLVSDLRRRGIRGSKATVYRTLPLLTEAGILQPAVISGDTRRYETAFGREHHDHLVCRGCGAVVEFEFEAFEILQREIAARHGFSLEGHLHQLSGRCRDCQARGRAARGAGPSRPTERN
ncbi:MAG TPA: Fur family transcriptional regulator [Anaeromyxobacteraceae bacterium]